MLKIQYLILFSTFHIQNNITIITPESIIFMILEKSTYFLILAHIKQIGKTVWKLESARYKKKGLLNCALALFFAYLYLWCFPIYIKSIWPAHIKDPLKFQLSIMLPIFPVSLLIGTLIYLPGYLGSKWYKQYQWNPEAKKEWEKEDWPTQKKKTLYYMLLDYFVVIPAYICGGMLISGPKMRMEGFPSHYEIISTFFFVLVIDDFLFMWVHRLMHEVPSIYKYHKLHHEYKTVASYTALYFHPIQELFNLVFLGTVIFMFMDVHFFSWILWSIFKLFASQEIHSGYIFPWSPYRIIPFYYETSYHYFHHSVNLGNYAGNIYIFEMLFGTNKLFIDQELARIDALEAAKKL